MTREEAIKELKELRNEWSRHIYSEGIRKRISLDMAIKALEQEPVIDKIRAEIEQITDTMGVSYNQYVSKIDVLQILDKHKAESEE